MPTRLTVKNRKFFRELENGTDFTLNPTSYGTHLKGSVGDRVKMTCDISIYTQIIPDNYKVETKGTEVTIISEGSFKDSGFWIGDIVKWRYVSGESDLEIIYSDEDKIVANRLSGSSSDGYVNNTDRRSFKLASESTDLRYTFNQQEQLESFDLKSIINGSESSFIVKEIDGTLKVENGVIQIRL